MYGSLITYIHLDSAKIDCANVFTDNRNQDIIFFYLVFTFDDNPKLIEKIHIKNASMKNVKIMRT